MLKDKVGLNVFLCPFDNEDKSVYIKLIFVCASLSIIVCMFCFVFPSSDILDVF